MLFSEVQLFTFILVNSMINVYFINVYFVFIFKKKYKVYSVENKQ